MSDRLKDLRGVHAMFGEHTICGDAFDAPQSEADWEFGDFLETTLRTVTCADCIRVIKFCKSCRYKDQAGE